MDTYDNEECGYMEKFFKAATSDEMKTPKIYYGTRTHKQIEQVIRELRKTCYTHKKMTILSSREHTCIQESTKNKTELCNDLLDPAKHKGCPFYNETNKKTLANFRAVKAHGLGPAWDIEDLVTIGKDIGVCPYFSARSLMEEADIIFCPYNYIVDPDIRETMQLDLKGQVIIVDEAHNIEDICRDVASVSFRDDHLAAAARECEVLVEQRTYDGDTYKTLKEYLFRLIKFLKDMILHTMNNTMNIEMSSPYYTGRELLEYLNMNNLGESVYSSIVAAGKAAIADSIKAKEDSRIGGRQSSVKPTICASTKLILQHLLFTLEVLTSKDFVDEFRACVIETVVTDYQTVQDDTWHSVKKQSHRARTLKLFCMNPGVTFSPIAEAARCVVLASGTLTPIGSFESELNTRFVHVLNTAHVIPKEQIFATCVPKGPTGIALKATFQNVNQWDFQLPGGVDETQPWIS
ncbi:Fanconi anemia group J protein homolog [Hylaeus anthracinus]|uniref:Fanconi anemia group J protein homolog n=1 Tax=Hylaeus anthracinus TaxID=313031 RepID=UPI0023B975C6|nr:Fanconi anemia group J protein homolog [Hylaeus anthracinus]XP_054012122.1 Fanconi anemia group J protein homolog [Hylaeus anthracinus]